MNMTLRTRLALLVAVSVALSVGLVLYLTWKMVGETMLRMEEKSFASLMLVEEESLNAAFMNQLASKVRAVRERKNQLEETAARVLGALSALNGKLPEGAERERLTRDVLSGLDSGGIRVELLRPADLFAGGVSRLGLKPDARDAKQRALGDILEHLPRSGDFAVMELPRSLTVAGSAFALTSELERPALAFFLPLYSGEHQSLPGRVLVTLTSLEDLEIQAAASEAALLEATREKFGGMSLYRRGLVALLNRDGEILASGGDGQLPRESLAPALEEARRTGRAQVTLPSAYGDLFCLVSYSRAFDWYTAMAAPLSEIRAPSDALLSRLCMISLAIMLLTSLLALFMLMRSLRPLGLLTRKTEELARVDFSAPDALEKLEPLMARGLPLERRDEPGQLARAFARMGAALAENIRDLMAATASKERMEGELSAARDIQMGILPPPDGAPEICGFSASAFLDPAKEVGGDLYDFFTTRDGRRALVLGDVSGKGVPAALFMSMTVTLVRYALDSGLDPAAAMTRVNAMLEEHNPGNMFVTLFLALYDPRSGELAYANGGHCPPCIVDARSDRPPRLLEHLSGPLVGVMPGLEYELFLDRLNDGETCLLFTDGVTEAMNENKELYGEERLMELMARHRNARPKELLSLIFQELLRYRGEEPQSDDITMLAFCRPDPEPETTTLSVEAHAARPGRPTNPNQTGDTGQ